MSEQAQVGDTVRMTVTVEGQVGDFGGRLEVHALYLDGPNRTVEILSRATPPLPSEPGTFWVGKEESLWRVDRCGSLYRPGCLNANASFFAPFHQLVRKEES